MELHGSEGSGVEEPGFRAVQPCKPEKLNVVLNLKSLGFRFRV